MTTMGLGSKKASSWQPLQRRLRRGVFCIKSWRCNGCQELAFFDPSPIVLIPTAHVAGDLAENSRLVPGLDCPWQDECARCGPVLRRDDLYRQRGLIIGDRSEGH